MSSEEYFPHSAILRKPVLVTRLHTGTKATCGYCGKEFEVVSYLTTVAENIDTGEKQIYLTSLSGDLKDECKERTLERLPDTSAEEGEWSWGKKDEVQS